MTGSGGSRDRSVIGSAPGKAAVYRLVTAEAGVEHALRNTGDAPMKILWIYTSALVTRTFVATGEMVDHLSPADRMVRDS